MSFPMWMMRIQVAIVGSVWYATASMVSVFTYGLLVCKSVWIRCVCACVSYVVLMETELSTINGGNHKFV